MASFVSFKRCVYHLAFILGLILPFALGFSGFAFAADYYYCGGTPGGYVRLGDSIAHVKSICGEPSTSSAKTDYQDIKVYRWIYNVRPFSSSLDQSPKLNAAGLVIDFQDGKYAQAIFVDGKEVTKTRYCRPDLPYELKLGDNVNHVTVLCGRPSQGLWLEKRLPKTDQVLLTLTYDNPMGGSSVKMVFENWKLIEIS